MTERVTERDLDDERLRAVTNALSLAAEVEQLSKLSEEKLLTKLGKAATRHMSVEANNPGGV